MFAHAVGKVKIDLVCKGGLLSLLTQHPLLPTGILSTIQGLRTNKHAYTHMNTGEIGVFKAPSLVLELF